MKLALGTVQFGLPYGVANRAGQVAPKAVRAILDLAAAHKIDTLDTAVSYGESEQRLGLAGVQGWQIVSKLPPVPADCVNVYDWVASTVKSSLEKLRVPRLYGLLLHRPAQLMEAGGSDLYRALQQIKHEGLVEKVGVSIYEPAELDVIFGQYAIDLVQAPFNILDRHLIDTGWLDRLSLLGAELHVRSIFLQGLLLMPYAERPMKFQKWDALWMQWERWLEVNHLTPVQACLRYVMSFPQIGKVVVGVDDVAQMKEIIQASIGELPEVPSFLVSDGATLLNPARWSELA